MIIVDRRELRFRILFEYYDKHHKRVDYGISDLDYRKLELPENEIQSAEWYLVEAGYLRGSNLGDLGSRFQTSSIVDISISGINFVEQVMDKVLAEVDMPDGTPEDTLEKITLFASICLKSPVVGTMCTKAFEVIVKFFETGVNVA